ncbi:homoserine dehydrogenase [candidate division KSB1 bacterium]
MREINTVVCGCGKVGRAFLRLLAERKTVLADRYGIFVRCVAVIDIDGAVVSGADPLDPGAVLDYVEQGGRVEHFPGSGIGSYGVSEACKRFEPGVIVECTPTDLKTGEPGMSHFLTALNNGWDIVTANKGPLVLDLPGLKQLAQSKNSNLRYSGATAAALPTLDVGSLSLAGSTILVIEGILNGTSNYILTGMAETGESYTSVLRKAQELGIAETDPALDVGGWDTAVKLLLLANSLLDAQFTLSDISVTGIAGVLPEDIHRAYDAGKALKLLGIVDARNGPVRLSVGPAELGKDHPLYAVNGAEKGVTFTTDTLGRITVTGGKSNPVGAAAALLKDLINLYRS